MARTLPHGAILLSNPSPVRYNNEMEIYLFWSEWDAEVFGFTSDPKGENLPADLAPWSRNGGGQAIYSRPDENQAPNTVVEAIRRDGFYLARNFSRSASSPRHRVH
jgi:hypothetical protein